MKNSFLGYYRPTSEEFEELWEKCSFTLDANVLLNLYRYSPETRDGMIEILEQVSDRLWVSHQAALEYQRNRPSVIAKQAAACKEVREMLEGNLNQLRAKLRQTFRGSCKQADLWLEKMRITFEDVDAELETLEGNYRALEQDDTLCCNITTLLAGRVGSQYPPDELEKIFKEGKTRYERKTPPGFCDAKRKEGADQYGDVVLWLQVVQYAKKHNTPVILVIDDRKEDWWWQPQGRIIAPHPELRQEMRSKAEVEFYMYQPDQFMKHAEEYLGIDVTESAIDEARRVTESGEQTAEFPVPYGFPAVVDARTYHPIHGGQSFGSVAVRYATPVEDLASGATPASAGIFLPTGYTWPDGSLGQFVRVKPDGSFGETHPAFHVGDEGHDTSTYGPTGPSPFEEAGESSQESEDDEDSDAEE